MAEKQDSCSSPLSFDRNDFRLGTLEDELRVDRLLRDQLFRFYEQLLYDGLSPDKATLLTNGADYFLRDFVVAKMEKNIFDEVPGLVSKFAGNWYIVNTLDPDITELSGHLEGVAAFYRFLCSLGFISEGYLDNLILECAETGWYAGRIESFWAIKGDGYIAWERECSLKD